MLVFIDDSGDPGFKLQKGSSLIFVISCIIFDEELEAEKSDRLIYRRIIRKHIEDEWKFR